MNNIRVDIRLRPIRFGFLVRPDDAENILEIFRINTCLWGGKFNPIFPFFKRVPSWWERHGFRFENARQIINGYLDFFEPDFLVEAEQGLADGFGFSPKRVLQLTDILERDGERRSHGYGLTVHNLYSELYREEFRFESRHQRHTVYVEAKNSIFAGFVASNFGSFPTQERLGYFEHNYKGIFDPKCITVDADELTKLYKSTYISALRIGCAKLRINYYDRSTIKLFILDAKKSRDLIDFWNLCAVYEHVIAVPIQWIETLSPFCRELILADYHSLDGNPNRLFFSPTSMFSRSIPENDIEDIHRSYLHVDERDANILQTWYPSIWSKPQEMTSRTTRPTLEADRKSVEMQIDSNKPEVQLDPLFPEFASEYGNRFRLANVVRLRDWTSRSQMATTFPCNYRNPTFPRFGIAWECPLSTTEGLVIFPEYRGIAEWWPLIDGTTAFSQWFKANQVSTTLSDAGRATQQIIQTLGGSSSVGCLAHKGIIELLDKMSRSRFRTAHYREFQNKIDAAIDNKRWSKGIFERLVECKVVELGLELKCDKCGSRSWYSVKQLDYKLTCDLCLKESNFPITSPSGEHSRWAYRLIGPFALPDYAKGGYAAALAIHLFASVLAGSGGRSEVTWSAGQEIDLPIGKKLEADFILWNQREENHAMDYQTEIVFGEAKSFGKDVFTQDDVSRMKMLAEAFPGSLLVFAMMKEELSSKEIICIKKLAEWGRKYNKETQKTRAPVIMLTGTELFTTMSLADSWEKKGGPHDKLLPDWERTHNLRVLADLTQQLYLGMPSYQSFVHDRIRKRRERNNRIMTQQNT